MPEKVGFIGLGAMGAPMSLNLLKAGYELTVYDMVPEKVEAIVKKGARAAESCQEVAMESEIIITMLPAPRHVREAILEANGVIEGAKEGSIVIDMSSIDPISTREISKALLDKNIYLLDAPVARSKSAAIAGTLAIFVGGEREIYERCEGILFNMGTDVHYVGESGAGSTVKVVNQLIIATSMCSLAEALVLGVKAGVKPEILFNALSNGSANSFVLQNHVKNSVLKGKFDKEVFPVEYMIKDLRMALTTAAEYDVPLYLGALTSQIHEFAKSAGYSKNYFPVLIKPLEDVTNVKVRANLEDE